MGHNLMMMMMMMMVMAMAMVLMMMTTIGRMKVSPRLRSAPRSSSFLSPAGAAAAAADSFY